MKLITILIFSFITLTTCKAKVQAGSSMPSVVYYSTIGDVKIFDPKGQVYVPKIMAFLQDGDKIQTGKKGRVNLLLATGGLLRILENSELSIDTKLFIESGQTRNRFKLSAGKLFVSQPTSLKKGESLEVITPTQIGGVRGTEFLAEATDESSKILVAEGIVQTQLIKDQAEVPELTDTAESVSEGHKSESDGDKRETLPLTDDERQSLAEQGKSAAQLLQEAKEQMNSIRDQFEKEREQIRIDVEKFKSENRAKLDEQKAINQESINTQKSSNTEAIEVQKATNKDLMNSTKGDSGKDTRDMQNSSETQKGEIKNKTKSDFEAIKQGMKK